MTWKNLNRIDPIPFPFQLELVDSDEILNCEELIRLLPGKRLVAFGQWGDKKIVAKLFYSSKAKLHLKKEVAGIDALVAARIPTPKLLWQGITRDPKIYVLIFEQIDGVNLDVIWQNKHNQEEIKQLMHAITLELATQHVLGIVQNDLHMKNFLISKKTIYTLDGSSISTFNDILPKEPSLNHLALFFAQLEIDTEPLQEELFQAYCKARGWIIKEADVEFLREAILKWTEKRWDNYEKKIHRNSTQFLRWQTSSALFLCDRNYQKLPALKKLLKNPDAIFEDANTRILKAGRSSTVALINTDKRSFVLKRYNIKSSWHWLRRCLRPSRAATSWRLAQRLRLFGIPTAKPIAFIENSFLGLRGKSYFLMEFVPGPDLGEYFSDYRTKDPNYEKVANKVSELFIHLAKLRLTHGDLKKTNILINEHNPVLIDLDGMVEHFSIIGLKNALKKEMSRFMKNWEEQPDVYDLFTKVIGNSNATSK